MRERVGVPRGSEMAIGVRITLVNEFGVYDRRESRETIAAYVHNHFQDEDQPSERLPCRSDRQEFAREVRGGTIHSQAEPANRRIRHLFAAMLDHSLILVLSHLQKNER